MSADRTGPKPVTPRASWKGVLKVAEVICPVSLYAAASTSERISFHILNRQTGHRVQRQFVDSVTDKVVEHEDQVKGYETDGGDVVILTPAEIAAAVPDSDKILDVQAFIPCSEVDTLFFERPYYLAQAAPAAAEAFEVIRKGMLSRRVAALARTVLFRRVRLFLIRPHGDALIATSLNFDYEVGSADDSFAEIPSLKIDKEMLDLARHIISTKMGKFAPADFDDRYENALAELVKAKLEGRKLAPPKPETPTKVVDLMQALRESAKRDRTDTASEGAPARRTPAKRKAG